MKQCIAIENESFGITNEKLLAISGRSRQQNTAALNSWKELLIQNLVKMQLC